MNYLKKTLLLLSTFFLVINSQAQYTLTINDVDFSNGKIIRYTNETEKEVIIPENFNGIPVTTIGEGLFSGTSNGFGGLSLISVQLPHTLTKIEYLAFYKNAFENIKLPSHHNGYIHNWYYIDSSSGDSTQYLSGDYVDAFNYGDYVLGDKVSAVNYTITYNLDGGLSTNPVTYTVEDNVILNDGIKSGYTFSGWFTDENFTEQITEIATGSIGDIQLFAKFTEEVITNLSAVQNLSFNVYPTSSSNYIYTTISVVDLTVIDLQGAIVKEIKNVTKNNFDISDLRKGYYVIKAKDKNGVVYNSTFIKK